MKKYFVISTVIAFALAIILMLNSTDYFAFAAKTKTDRQAPTAPANLKTITVTDKSVTMSWNASSDNVGVRTYDVYKNNSYYSSTSETTYTASGLTPDNEYQFYIKAKDAKGNVSNASNIISVKTSSLTDSMSMMITKKIIGYYTAWSAYSGYTPDKIDATKLTHINYAFADIGQDLKITLGYPDVDLTNIKKLQILKQSNPYLKTLISIGGWTWSGKFSDAALTEGSRTVFADNCVDFMLQHGFDGIDIDWEYPVSGGLSTNVKRPEDKMNFTLLLQKIREKLDARGLIDNKHYLLTIAGGASNYYLKNIEAFNIHRYIDYANIMTYDIHGSWDSFTDFNAPLYSNSDASPQYKWSVDSSLNAWVQAGFPAEKIIIGIPFYGYVFNQVNNINNGLYQNFSASNSISFNTIATKYLNENSYTRYFHSQSMVPWLFNGSTFISYEDSQSIGLKTNYIKSKNISGAMIWELSQDYNSVLLNALYDGLK